MVDARDLKSLGEVPRAGSSPAVRTINRPSIATNQFAALMKDLPVTQYAKAGEVYVAYQVFGTGTSDLVFVPGWMSHLDLWWDSPLTASWLTRLGRFAPVIMFDKRGTGLSDRTGGLPGMDQRMDDIRAVMDAAGSKRA